MVVNWSPSFLTATIEGIVAQRWCAQLAPSAGEYEPTVKSELMEFDISLFAPATCAVVKRFSRCEFCGCDL